MKSRAEVLRSWVDRWGPTLSLGISTIGLIGLGITIFSFFLQLEENREAQRETSIQIRTLTDVLGQLRVQNDAATQENSIAAANSFWQSGTHTKTDATIKKIDAFSLDPNASLQDFPESLLVALEQDWSPIFDCADSVSCDAFEASRRKHRGRSLCTFAIDRSQGLEEILLRVFSETNDPALNATQATGSTPMGQVTCFCPFDEGGGNVSFSKYCLRKAN